MLTQSGALGVLLVGPVSHTSKIYMDFVQIFNASTVFVFLLLYLFHWALSFFCV